MFIYIFYYEKMADIFSGISAVLLLTEMLWVKYIAAVIICFLVSGQLVKLFMIFQVNIVSKVLNYHLM